MRVRTVVFALLAGTTIASAQPGAELPPPDAAPEPEPPPVEVTPPAPGAAVPPITINITNNNTGNNNNTQTNSQDNAQTNSQANPQTTTAPITLTTTVAAPGAIAPLPAPVDQYELLRAKQKPSRWITLGVTRERHGHPSGIRGSIDLIGRGAWTLGVAGAISHDGKGRHASWEEPDRDDDDDDDDHHGRPSATAIAYLAWTGKLGRLDVRAQIGLGADIAAGPGWRGDDDDDDDDDTIKRSTDDVDDSPGRRCGRLGMRAEAAVLVGLPLGKRLGLIAGPVITAGKPEAGETAVDGKLLAGLRFRF
jgi:hypothetical protein